MLMEPIWHLLLLRMLLWKLLGKQHVSTYYLHKDLIATIKLNKLKKVMFYSGNTAATYAMTDISLEYDVIINDGIQKKSLETI